MSLTPENKVKSGVGFSSLTCFSLCDCNFETSKCFTSSKTRKQCHKYIVK